MTSPIQNTFYENFKLTGHEQAPYLQFANYLLNLIKSGKIPSGVRLPSTRTLSLIVGLNRQTIIKAIYELESQGWLISKVGNGTFVSNNLPIENPINIRSTNIEEERKSHKPTLPILSYLKPVPSIQTTPLHLDDGFPDPKLSPIADLYRNYRNQLSRGDLYNNFGSYANPEGSDYFRISISNYLNETRSMQTKANNICSVNGTVMALNLICNSLLKPNDIVVAGVPGWGRAEQNFIHAGASLVGIEVDQHGIVVEQLEGICKLHPVKMVYITPHHHYPTTVSLSLERRLQLLDLSYTYGFFIIEDDYDFDFHYALRPLLPLASIDNYGHVIYCGSFSKTLTPAFRMGFIAAPEHIIAQIGRIRMLVDRQGDQIMDNALAELITDGTIQRTIRKALKIYEARRDFFCDLINNKLANVVEYTTPQGGLSIWAKFDKSVDLNHLSSLALQKGLMISNGQAHQYESFIENAIRLGFASSSLIELEQSVSIIKTLVTDGRVKK